MLKKVHFVPAFSCIKLSLHHANLSSYLPNSLKLANSHYLMFLQHRSLTFNGTLPLATLEKSAVEVVHLCKLMAHEEFGIFRHQKKTLKTLESVKTNFCNDIYLFSPNKSIKLYAYFKHRFSLLFVDINYSDLLAQHQMITKAILNFTYQ